VSGLLRVVGLGVLSLKWRFMRRNTNRPRPSSISLVARAVRAAPGPAALDASSLFALTPALLRRLVHLWELGGGIHLSDLIKVSLHKENFANAVCLVVVDLSQPDQVVDTCRYWLRVIQHRAEVVASELAEDGVNVLHLMADKAGSPMAKALTPTLSHPRSLMGKNPTHPFPDPLVTLPAPPHESGVPEGVPIYIVANKYDKFKDAAPEARKATAALPAPHLLILHAAVRSCRARCERWHWRRVHRWCT
jgi:hypothetical protein